MSKLKAQNKIEFEKIINENYVLDESFFEEHVNLFTGDYYYVLMYAYFLINQKELIKYENLVSKISVTEIKDKYNLSLFFMIEACNFIFKNENIYAEQKFKLALQLDEEKKNKYLRLELYFYHFNSNNDYLAFGFLNEAIEIDPQFNKAIIEECKTLDEEYNYDLIIQKLEKISIGYNDPELYQMLGVAYFNAGNVTEAIKLIESSISIKSNSINNFSLGYIYDNELEDFQIAEKFYLISLSHESENLDALNAYAWLKYKMGDIGGAEKIFLKQSDLSNEQTVYDQIIQFYLHTNSYEEARGKIKESRLINGNNFTNEGLEIILFILKKDPYEKFVQKYKKKYSDFEVQWLKEQIRFYLEK